MCLNMVRSGATVEKGTDIIFEAMGKQCMSIVMQKATKKELRDRLSKVIQ